MKSKFILLTVAAGLLAVTGCKSVSVSSTRYIGGPIYAPSNPAMVQVLNTPPTRANLRLGEVRVQPSSDQVPMSKIVSKLRQAASQMGADAIYIVSDRNVVTGVVVAGPFGNPYYHPTSASVIVGVAVKYVGP